MCRTIAEFAVVGLDVERTIPALESNQREGGDADFLGTTGEPTFVDPRFVVEFARRHEQCRK